MGRRAKHAKGDPGGNTRGVEVGYNLEKINRRLGLLMPAIITPPMLYKEEVP